MKIKFILLTIIFAFGAVSVSTKAVLDGGSTGGGGVITTVTTVRKFCVAPSDIVVAQTSALDITFNADKGLVDVVIKDANGSIIYSQSVNTSSSNTLHINTFGFDAGSYSITFADANGNTLLNHSFEISK